MRMWISVPIAKGIRTGVSLNPGNFVTRKLSHVECLSEHGKKVYGIGAGMIAFCVWLWVFADFNAILAALIVWLIATWVWKRITLANYPRDFTETNEPAVQPEEQRTFAGPWSSAEKPE